MRAAATRVFSNSSGSYSSNVNLAVENSSWSDESQLQEMYLKRKSYAFNSDRLSSVECHQTSRALVVCLRKALLDVLTRKTRRVSRPVLYKRSLKHGHWTPQRDRSGRSAVSS